MNKALFILHYSPPVHGASKVGDSILNSSIISQELDAKFIKIKSSDSIDVIGKFNGKKILYFIELFFKICWSLLWFRPQIIYYTASPYGFAFYRDLVVSVPIKIYRKLSKTSLFYHYHAKGIDSFLSQSSINKKLTNFLLKNTTILLISKLMKSEIRQVNTYKNVVFINNGVETTLNKEDFLNVVSQRVSSNKASVLYLSNMIKEKGYDTILETVRKVKESGLDNIEFNFAGGWATNEDEQFFNNYVKEYNLQEYVTFHGLVQGEKKKSLFSNATIFVFPSRYKKEVFPISVLEALSYGLPILGFNAGAVSKIINAKIGVISNKELIFEDLKKMIVNYQSTDNYKVCREEYLSKYTIDVFERKLTDILTSS